MSDGAGDHAPDVAPPAPDLDALAAFVADVLGSYDGEGGAQGGVYRPGDGRRLAAIGVALEPWPGLRAWAAAERLDALFLHRPWRLADGALADGVGVVWSHLPFDERLTTGFNPRLAAALDLRGLVALGERDGRALGMHGAVVAAPAATWIARVRAEFGGEEATLVPDPDAAVARVAVVGAMTDALVREAADRGVGLYVTGQLRHPGRAAAAERGVAVVAVGHARSEWWGARTLATIIAERWRDVRVVVAPGAAEQDGAGAPPHRDATPETAAPRAPDTTPETSP